MKSTVCDQCKEVSSSTALYQWLTLDKTEGFYTSMSSDHSWPKDFCSYDCLARWAMAKFNGN